MKDLLIMQAKFFGQDLGLPYKNRSRFKKTVKIDRDALQAKIQLGAGGELHDIITGSHRSGDYTLFIR